MDTADWRQYSPFLTQVWTQQLTHYTLNTTAKPIIAKPTLIKSKSKK